MLSDLVSFKVKADVSNNFNLTLSLFFYEGYLIQDVLSILNNTKPSILFFFNRWSKKKKKPFKNFSSFSKLSFYCLSSKLRCSHNVFYQTTCLQCKIVFNKCYEMLHPEAELDRSGAAVHPGLPADFAAAAEISDIRCPIQRRTPLSECLL